MASDIPLALPKTDRAVVGSSAAVEIKLQTGAGVYYPTHAAHDRLNFSEPLVLAPSIARLVISIDGVEQASTIEILPHDSPSDRIPVRIV